jgi:hypothetical protein
MTTAFVLSGGGNLGAVQAGMPTPKGTEFLALTGVRR